jgi:hypothetical protein
MKTMPIVSRMANLSICSEAYLASLISLASGLSMQSPKG